jgi:hypothetical protein
MAWKGVDDDPVIYWSHTARGLEPQDWAPQREEPNLFTSEGPSLAVFENQLMMVWKGPGFDGSVSWSSISGVRQTFGLGLRIRAVGGTSRGPRLSPLSTFGPLLLDGRGPNGQKLWMAWKGAAIPSGSPDPSTPIEDDPGIYWSSTDRFFGDWAPQKKVEGVGTSEGAALAFFAPVPSRTPTLNPNDGMEVTQAIQDMNHTVQLIAKKKTVVRMYLENAQLAQIVHD